MTCYYDVKECNFWKKIKTALSCGNSLSFLCLAPSLCLVYIPLVTPLLQATAQCRFPERGIFCHIIVLFHFSASTSGNVCMFLVCWLPFSTRQQPRTSSSLPCVLAHSSCSVNIPSAGRGQSGGGTQSNLSSVTILFPFSSLFPTQLAHTCVIMM